MSSYNVALQKSHKLRKIIVVIYKIMKITCKVVSGILNMNEIVACSLKLIRCHSVIRTIDYKVIVAIFD